MTATVRTQDDTARISTDGRDGVVIVRPVGGLDRSLADDLRETVLGAHAPVVIDLADCVLIDPRSLRHVALAWEHSRPEVCIVCHRRTGRHMLRRLGVGQHLAIFSSVDDAIDARRDRRTGWTPSRTG